MHYTKASAFYSVLCIIIPFYTQVLTEVGVSCVNLLYLLEIQQFEKHLNFVKFCVLCTLNRIYITMH